MVEQNESITRLYRIGHTEIGITAPLSMKSPRNLEKFRIGQANKGSFLGRFGGGPKRAADSLLRHNLISVIASDAHSPLQRTPYMMDVYEELSREYSENHLDVLFQYNPARICDNREILRLEPVPYSGRQQLY